jgi:hypothetical protein
MAEPVDVLRGRLLRVIRFGRRVQWALEIVGDQLNWCEGERRRLLACEKALREALERISKIDNQPYGSDWQEIELARRIARVALAGELPPRSVPTLNLHP